MAIDRARVTVLASIAFGSSQTGLGVYSLPLLSKIRRALVGLSGIPLTEGLVKQNDRLREMECMIPWMVKGMGQADD
jgi:hypothetical protein